MPRATDNVFRLIAFLVVSFFVQWAAANLFSSPQLAAKLSLQFHNFNLFQIFTHPFLHANTSLPWGLVNVLFVSLVLYFFGSDLETGWGPHNFLKFFLYGILGAMVLGFFVSRIPGQHHAYYGIAGGNAAVLVAYAMFWPDRKILFMFFIPMKMKWFIVLLFIFLAFPGGASALVQYSGGALAGAFFLYHYARKGRHRSLYSNVQPPPTSLFGSLKNRWDSYARRRRIEAKQKEIERRIQMKAQVDALLEKISQKGMGSLSRKEKTFLDHASKEL